MSAPIDNLAATAERSVLGGILLSCESLPPGLELLRPGDFSNPMHAHVFAAMQMLHSKQEPIDTITVQALLTSEGTVPRQGWPVLLAELMESTATAANVEYYAVIVRREARRRDFLSVMTEAMGIARQEGVDGDDVIARAITQLGRVAEGRELTRPVLMRDLVRPELEAMERRRNEPEIVGLPTGFLPLDRRLGGLRPGNLIILAARPSMGKSAFATNMVAHQVTRHGKAALVFTFEMTREEVVQRMLASEARADLQRIITGRTNPDEVNRLTMAANRLFTEHIAIVDKPALPIAEVRSIARTHAARQQLDVIVVDYLQLMTGVGDNREQEVASISRGLKALAMELRIPIVALSQLNRSLEQRSDKRPMLSDLRESGSLEQDANVVLFLYRHGYYEPKCQDPDVTEIGIAKNRNGPPGKIKLKWTGNHTRFDPLDDDNSNMPLGAQGEAQ